MKLSNDVEKYEIEVTKWVKTTHFFLQLTVSKPIYGRKPAPQQLANHLINLFNYQYGLR